ncbi:MAG: hypothetical protein ACXWL2_01130 [Candidatus Chromulinivorax sp.]
MLNKKIFSLTVIIMISTCYTIQTSNDKTRTIKNKWRAPKNYKFPGQSYRLSEEEAYRIMPDEIKMYEIYENDPLRRIMTSTLGLLIFTAVAITSKDSISEQRVIYNVPQNLNSKQALHFMQLNPFGYNNQKIDTLYTMIHQDETNPKQECPNWIYIENPIEKLNLRKR